MQSYVVQQNTYVRVGIPIQVDTLNNPFSREIGFHDFRSTIIAHFPAKVRTSGNALDGASSISERFDLPLIPQDFSYMVMLDTEFNTHFLMLLLLQRHQRHNFALG